MSIHALRQTARPASSAPAYNPLTAIPWVDAYWAEGPNFQALGLTNGAPVTTWPTEVSGGTDLVATAGTPAYAATGLGGRPAVQAFGSEVFAATAPSIAQPWTVATVAARTGGSTSGGFIGAQSGSASFKGLVRDGFAAGAVLACTLSLTGAFFAIALANGASSSVTQNGSTLATGNAGTSAVAVRQMMARSTPGALAPLTGLVGFGGYIGRDLTSGERADLLAWSQSHYGTP